MFKKESQEGQKEGLQAKQTQVQQQNLINQKNVQKNLPLKKKKIKRKKYRQRNNRTLIHTVCLITKNGAEFKKSIIESFVFNSKQKKFNSLDQKIMEIVQQKNAEYIRKVKESIKLNRILNVTQQNQNQNAIEIGRQLGSIQFPVPLWPQETTIQFPIHQINQVFSQFPIYFTNCGNFPNYF